jgi:hypothetical protein
MAQRQQHLKRWALTGKRAITHGGALISATRIHWDVSGRGRLQCEKPVYREYIGGEVVGYRFQEDRAVGAKNRRSIEFDTRCRRCGPCLEARKLLWRGRARTEIAQSSRTWFGTLTLSPDQQVLAMMRASLRLAKSGIDFLDLPKEEQFSLRVKEISPEITKWLKRVRKQSSVKTRQDYRKIDGCEASKGVRCNCHPLPDYTVKLKYLIVIEAHTGGGLNDGLPHFHLLIHEADANRPVRHSVLKQKWTLGHTDFRLIPSPDMGGYVFANYVTKYLTKSILCRARGSLKYGLACDLSQPKL